MRGKGKIRIWPVYFDIRYSRGDGRRVPRDKAVRDPKLEDIEKVAMKLGFSKQPWRRTGVVLVDKKGSKSEIINNIAGGLRG